MPATETAERLSLELKYRPPGGDGSWASYGRLADRQAYDAWYFYHYGSEIFRARQLRQSGCSFEAVPRKEKSLLTYIALAARPQFDSVLEIGSSLLEIIDGLELTRTALAESGIPRVALESIEFLGIENSAFLGYASQSLHPDKRTRIFPDAASCEAEIDLVVDRATAGLVFQDTASFASFLRRATAGVLNLFVSSGESFGAVVQDMPFVYFSLRELIERLDGRLYHLFGEKAPGYDRSQGRQVVEGFFLYGDAAFAEDFRGALTLDPRVAAYAAEKRLTVRPARELLP